MIKEITRSLSARLVAVFFVTSLVYGVGSFYAVQLVRQTDYVREIVGSHIALHAELVLNAIGTPPDPVKAEAIVNRVPGPHAPAGRRHHRLQIRGLCQ